MILIKLIGEIVLRPGKLLRNPKENDRAIILLFVINFCIVFVKSFFKEHKTTDFFTTKITNKIFNILSVPQVAVIVLYCGFFVFWFAILLGVKLTSTKVKSMQLLLGLMAVSGIGIIAHCIAIPLMIINRSLCLPLEYVFYLWAIVLNILSIQHSQNITFSKSIIAFVFAVIPFLMIGYLSPITPYLVSLAI